MKQLQTYISGIMAGLAIALGGTVYLSVENQIVGALFFTVGLFTVCTMNFQLYTGRVCSDRRGFDRAAFDADENRAEARGKRGAVVRNQAVG